MEEIKNGSIKIPPEWIKGNVEWSELRMNFDTWYNRNGGREIVKEWIDKKEEEGGYKEKIVKAIKERDMEIKDQNAGINMKQNAQEFEYRWNKLIEIDEMSGDGDERLIRQYWGHLGDDAVKEGWVKFKGHYIEYEKMYNSEKKHGRVGGNYL